MEERNLMLLKDSLSHDIKSIPSVHIISFITCIFYMSNKVNMLGVFLARANSASRLYREVLRPMSGAICLL